MIIRIYMFVMCRICLLHFEFTSAIQWNAVKSMYLVSTYIDSSVEDESVSSENTPVLNLKAAISLKTDQLMENEKKYAINRIFGGSEALPNSFAYQVGFLLQRPRGLYWCGGSLISQEYVLTAAHCVDMASRALVFLGAHDIKDANESGQMRLMVHSHDFIIFPTWSPRKLKDDIALVHLPTPVSYNERIQPIQLPYREYAYRSFENKLAIASGWGRYVSGVHAISNVLRYVRLRIVDGKTCKRSYPFSYRSTNVCTSGANQKSTCNGDSGGPLVLQRRNSKQRVLVGITSFGSILGCDRGFPAAFTKVASYLDWISDETGIDPGDDRWNTISFKEISKKHHYKYKDRDVTNADTFHTNFKHYPDAELLDITLVDSVNYNTPFQRQKKDYSIFVFH
ncbi:chymotrypsin BI [Glossina fuscipes]|uniref:Chymotrypsin BI n=1 Tax=Glossina fuscipes TaxID=7396 RepID=A0A9C6DSH8_9MUSC|nr:chymotrypsin BI [Glossina fuscipes]KAI9581332.1 hypothetical protein GQX74_012657 [Glossina fuscipes]